jgi:hypothetical protein
MKRIYTLYFLILLPLITFCQTEKQLVPSDLKQLTVVTEPATLYKGFFRTGINMSYVAVDKYFTNEGKRSYFYTNGWVSNSSVNFSLQYGITNRIQVDLVLPYVSDLQHNQIVIYAPSADTTLESAYTLRGKGLGDMNAVFKYQIIPESDKKPSLTARVYLTLPTGEKNPSNIKGPRNYDNPTGNGSFSTELNLTYRRIVFPYSYTVYMGYEYSFSGTKLMNATDTEEKEFNDGDVIRAGATFNFHLNEWIAFTNGINFFHKGKNKIENAVPEDAVEPWVVAYEPHLVFQINRFRLAEAIVIPLFGKNQASADPQYVVIAQYLF